MDRVALTITLLNWSIFYVFWVIEARRTKKNAKRESVAGSISYRIPAVLAILLLVNAHKLGVPFSTELITDARPISVLAVALSLSGLAICIWSRVTLGRNWSSVVAVKNEHELIQSGPYCLVRHPIYLGMIMMFLANVLLSGRLGGILGVICLVVSFYVKLLREEELMLAEFPGQYPDYCRRVKRLIPFIH